MIKVCSLDFLNKEFFEADVKLADGRIIINVGEKVTQELVLRLYFKEIYIDEPVEVNEKQVFVPEKTEEDLPRELAIKKVSTADTENEFIRAKTSVQDTKDKQINIPSPAKNINSEDNQYSIPSPDNSGYEDNKYSIDSPVQRGYEDNQYSIKSPDKSGYEDNQYLIKSPDNIDYEDKQYSIESPDKVGYEDNQVFIPSAENIGREDKQYSISSAEQNADYQETSFIKTKEPQSCITEEFKGISQDKLLNQDLSDTEAVSTEQEVMYKNSGIDFEAEQSEKNSQEADFAFGKEKEEKEIKLGNLKFDKEQAEKMAKLAIDTGKLIGFGRNDLDDLRDAALNCNIGIVKFNDTDLDNKNFEICKAAESADMAESEGEISDNAIETIRMYPSSYESKGFSLSQTIPHYNILGIVYFYQKMLDETGSKGQVLDKMLKYGGNKFNIFVLHKFIRLMRETNDQPTT